MKREYIKSIVNVFICPCLFLMNRISLTEEESEDTAWSKKEEENIWGDCWGG